VEDGMPAPVKPGMQGVPRETPGTSISGEILLTPRGTLGLRGPMVAVAAYAPPPPPSDSLMAPPPRDYVDTEYAARIDKSTGAIIITAPPSGVMSVGGYRFLASDLQEWSRPRAGQCAGPRSASRTRTQSADGGSVSRSQRRRVNRPRHRFVDVALTPAH
jgi:hypothetical protein